MPCPQTAVVIKFVRFVGTRRAVSAVDIGDVMSRADTARRVPTVRVIRPVSYGLFVPCYMGVVLHVKTVDLPP